MRAGAMQAGKVRRLRGAAMLAAAAVLGACQVGPVYERPELELPARYTAAVPDIVGTDDPDTRWWERFDDPLLEELIRRSLRRNLDVAAARSRVREARAIARGVAAGQRPTLDASGGPSAVIRSGDGRTDSEGALDALLSFGWDADLFGGRRSATVAAEAEAVRQEALRRATSLAVASETANAYVALRGAQLRLALTEESLELQRQTLGLVRQRAAAGLAASLDEVRAEAAVSTLSADVPPVRTEIGRGANALAVLVGELPGALNGRLEEPQPVPVMDVGPAVGVPAELLRRRPDMRAAEYNLVRATADVGVATAALYPRLTLPGSIGFDLTGIGAGGLVTTVVASIAAVLNVPLLDGGARRADLDAAEERADQALIAYRQTLLTALEEVEAALIGHTGARARADALREAAASNQTAAERARSLYTQGLAGFIDVLDAQRELTNSRLALAQAETALALEAIALYRALGGPAVLEAPSA